MKKIVLIAAILVFSALSLQAQWGSFNGIITTNSVTGIQTTSAVGGGSVELASGDPAVTQHGVCWSTSVSPTTSNSKTTEGSNANSTFTFTSNISPLSANQVYYVRAYIQNAANETQYGNQVAFATIPTLGEWGLIALGSLFAIGGGWFVWRRMA